jgi:hypothetical protein
MHPSRRLFLLSAPIVGGGMLAWRTSPEVEAQAACPEACADDPVLAAAAELAKAGVQGLRGRSRFRGESARQIASGLRIAVAQSKAKNLDASFRRGLKREVARVGRDNVVLSVDKNQFAATAQEFGVAIDPQERLDLVGGRRVLDALLKRGFTPVLESGAAFFGAVGAELDRQHEAIRPVQITKEQQLYCAGLLDHLGNYSDIAAFTCAIAPFVPNGAAACLFATMVYLGAKYHYENYSGCR